MAAAHAADQLGKATGMLPGSEMLSAIEAGRVVGARLVLIDMSIEQIMAEIRAIPVLHKLSMFLQLLLGATFGPKTVNLSDVPEERLVRQVLRYMAKAMPEFYRVLVTERNTYMASWIRELAKRHKKIVVVVGLGHKAGLQKLLNIKSK